MSRPLQTVVEAEVSITPESTQKKDIEWVRFFFHSLGISLCGIFAYVLPIELAFAILIGSTLFFTWYEWIRCRPNWMNALQSKWLLPIWPITYWMPWATKQLLVRPHEEETRTATLDLMLGFSLVWVTCPTWITVTACFITAWSDPMARAVGITYGETKVPFSKKTIIGTMTCFIVAAVVTLIAFMVFHPDDRYMITKSLILGVIIAVLELIPQKSITEKILSPADNFCLITGSAIVLQMLT